MQLSAAELLIHLQQSKDLVQQAIPDGDARKAPLLALLEHLEQLDRDILEGVQKMVVLARKMPFENELGREVIVSDLKRLPFLSPKDQETLRARFYRVLFDKAPDERQAGPKGGITVGDRTIARPARPVGMVR
jgi:hypothetical protein